MMRRMFLGAVAAIVLTTAAGAQQLPLPYGSPVTLAQAKRIVAAAEQSAQGYLPICGGTFGERQNATSALRPIAVFLGTVRTYRKQP
jgi:hypothetical protein